MIQAPRTVLLVDDDAAARHLYAHALPPHLPYFAVTVAENGAEALRVLAERPVEVLVTDLHMPVMSGFELLARMRERHANVGVIVLSSMLPDRVAAAEPRLGSYRRVAKPIPAAELAGHVRAAAEERIRGHIAEVPLAALLQLLQVERTTCSLLVRSGARKGRLHFRDGALVDAYAFELDADGEVAARYLMAWQHATVDFERSLHNHVQRIQTPLAELLIDTARGLDERRHDRADPSPRSAPRTVAPPAGAPPPPSSALGDAALDRLAAALAGLRVRARTVGAQLAPARGIAEEGAARGVAVVDQEATPEARAVDARVADLARHLAARAHVLADDVAGQAAEPPTWRPRSHP